MKANSSNPIVSVIIPCFNLGEYLEEAIQSVRNQTFKNWEIIVIDDGSTDRNTNRVISRLKKDQTIKVIEQANAGPAAARNRGIDEAKGTYIVCLDADDKLVSTYIEETLHYFKEDKKSKIAFVTTWLKEFGERDDIWRTPEFSIEKILLTNVAHAASIFRKKLWKEVGGYKIDRNLQGYEDWEFWLSLVEKGYEWISVPKILFNYRIRTNSLLSSARSQHLQKYKLIVNLHAALFKQYFAELALGSGREIAQLRQMLADKDKLQKEEAAKLEEQNQTIADLRRDLAKCADELNHLTSSRLISKTIVIREVIGKLRHKAQGRISGIRTGIHQFRVRTAPLMPKVFRKFVKHLFRMLKYRTFKPYVIYIDRDIQKWKKGSPLVSVIIPYFNRADTIDATLHSLADQTFRNFEVILVDDGSTDQASKVKLQQLDKRNLNLEILYQENQGVAAARNYGISKSRGKYIVCLDSDDMLDPTYIEKAVLVLEANPDIALITCHQQMFGVDDTLFKKRPYDPNVLLEDNMIISAAMFRRDAWVVTGGHKSNIGYEDWEYWLSLGEKGFWGKLIPEALFKYRTATMSRYVEDKSRHTLNVSSIHALHPRYQKLVKAIQKRRNLIKERATKNTALINLKDAAIYNRPDNDLPNILIAIPWMTFGGAETLLFNFCNEVKSEFNISFVTGLESEHEWEYKFKEISTQIYHLANLFEDNALYVEFISNYVASRNIKVIHIVHTSFMFNMVKELKSRHPDLKIIVTVFNDRAEHFTLSLGIQKYIDAFSTDNAAVVEHYKSELPRNKPVHLIPNGIDCYSKFDPKLFNRVEERASLIIDEDELAVFFVGRLSEEKNPDVFLAAAEQVINKRLIPKMKFFVIGDGPMRRQVEDVVKSIGKPEVQFLGYQAEVARFLSAADIFVLPSSIEGFPLSILEAMAMRLVVVASDVGAVAEVVDSDGFVIPAGSASSIVDVLLQLHRDKTLLNKIKEKARQKVEAKYSNKILGENYRKLYRSVIG